MSEVRTYTEHYVSEAVDAAMGMILDEFEIDDEQEEILALMVNATMTILASEMTATIEDVIEENYAVDVNEWKGERGL
ncbi:hypothetical protein ACFYW9_19155 [Streptomyces sp. NPDC002698]|uniref:hypothetical protein n=1 Tax=Streptomyces sp. NPDC002698 TaxID=3364660 RepID=UPI003683CF6D